MTLRSPQPKPPGRTPPRRVRRRNPRPGAILGIAFLLLLAVLAFLQAKTLAPWLLRAARGDGPEAPSHEPPGDEVRVFVAAGPPGLVLKTPLDLPEADRRDAEQLDRALFPDGPRHRYWLLHVVNEGEEPLSFDPDAGPVLRSGSGGEEWHAADLSDVLHRREGGIEPWLATDLRLVVAPDGPIAVPPGEARRLLFAYPEAAAPESVAGARIGTTELVARAMKKDALDRLVDRRDAVGEAREP